MLNIKSIISAALLGLLIQNKDSLSKKLSNKFFTINFKSTTIYFKNNYFRKQI